MAAAAIRHILRHLDSVSDDADCDDGFLLDAFLLRRDEAAFTLLVRRLGPVVWGVCRRVLGDGPDAEDAFQATFLVLLRKANSVRPRSAVGPWLYGVAVRTARKVRALQLRQRRRETSLPDLPATVSADIDRFDWKPLLDRELARLPERYRTAILLCDLQGLTRQDAARHLGLAEGTLSSRLARGRERLRQRLVRAGVTLSAGALATALAVNRAEAVPMALRTAVMQMVAASGADGVSASVAALGNGVVQAMWISKFKPIAAAVMVVAMIGGGWGLIGHSSIPGPTATAAPQDKPLPAAQSAQKRYTFEIRDMPWTKVFEWLTDQTGVPYQSGEVVNLGTFTFVSPRQPGQPAPTYTLPEIIGILDEGLIPKGYVLVFRKSFFELVAINPLQQWNTKPFPTPPDYLKPLQGNWKVLSGVYSTADQSGFVPVRAKIDGDRLQLTFRKPTGEERDAALVPTIRLNPATQPKQIDIHTGFGPTDYVKRGIYSVQGDTLLLSLQEAPEKARPTDFTDNVKDGQSLLILQRERATDPRLPTTAKGGDLERIQGAWELMATESGIGAKPPKDMRKVRFIFEGNKFTTPTTGQTEEAYAFQLNESRDPKEIDIVMISVRQSGAAKGRGIYSVTGDALLLCVTFDEKEARPTDFTVPQGSKRVLHILRRDATPRVVRPLPRDPNVNQEALAEYRIRVSVKNAADADAKAAEATVAIMETDLAKVRKLYNERVGTESDIRKAELEVHRSRAELEGKKAAVVKAEQEIEKARAQLEMHHIPPPPLADQIEDLNRRMAEMQAEIARLREELRKSRGKTP